jgi:hypothetical protein
VTLPRLLDRAARPMLLLLDAAVPAPIPQQADVSDVVVRSLDGDRADLVDLADRRWASVVVAVPDRAALRRAGDLPPRVGRTRAVVAWVATAQTPVVPAVRPEWAEPLEVDAHLTDDGGAVSRLRFRAGVPVHEVLAQLGRDAGSPGAVGQGGLVVGRFPEEDPRSPADVLVAGGPETDVGPVASEVASEVTGRAPVVVLDDPDEPVTVDEGVFAPGGFRRDWTRGVVDLPPGPVDDGTVAALRDAQAVRLPPGKAAYDVAALAMAGVPLRGVAPPGIAPELAALVTAPVDLDDALVREEHSVRLRRAAAAAHSTLARRVRLAGRAGVRVAGLPLVSVVLATRRPELLPFALTQVAKQGVDVELVLAPHGFEVDGGVVRDHLGDRPVVVRPATAETRFGDVLDAAAGAASGDVVLKMDDDDWYGPDVVADLLWARRTSGAELVGMAAEFVYLEQLDLTVRRRSVAERPARVVAGGTMMVGRDYLRGLGGFRSVTRFVDAQLLAAVRVAGGSVHRTQGLGYVLRRAATGHTWSPDLGYFLRRRSMAGQWRGFRPSTLLTYGDAERPPGRRA